MGRMFGWIGPIGYLVAVVATCVALVSGTLAMYIHAGCVPEHPRFDIVALCVWFLAILWFVFQAAILRSDEVADEKWTAHFLNVSLVSRIVLVPLGVAALWHAALCAIHAPSTLMSIATFGACELVPFAVIVPAAAYQICAATRLANRGMLKPGALVAHVLLALLPVVGFVACCSLHVNGHAALDYAHDVRVARLAAEKVQESIE